MAARVWGVTWVSIPLFFLLCLPHYHSKSKTLGSKFKCSTTVSAAFVHPTLNQAPMAQLHQVVISAPPRRRVRAAAVAAVAAVGLLAAVSATPSALACGS